MSQEGLAGYALLAGCGLMLLLAVKIFGFRRVMLVIFGVFFLGLVMAIASLRAVTDRR